MKKIVICLFLNLLLTSFIIANDLDSIELNHTRLYYHYVKSHKQTKGLLFFLHGSTKVFKGQKESKPVEISTLLEGNKDFLSAFTEKGYDVIIPISFNEYNWLEDKGVVYIDSLTKLYSKKYESIFIAGFSDGGTGAYRIFYNNLATYKGLAVFNGYPQHNNNYKKVDYKKCISQKIVFFSQTSDKVVPYEFLLTEYRRQKLINYNTYFFLTEGKHEFIKYSTTDFEKCISLLELNDDNYKMEKDSMWIFPPLDGLIINDTIQKIYTFRSKIGREYGMDKQEYEANTNVFSKIENGKMNIYPLKIHKNDLTKSEFTFKARFYNNQDSIKIKNYQTFNTW